MQKISRKIVQLRVPILILSVILLIPAAIGFAKTRVNYDILTYLPKDIDTMKGQDIMVDEFGTGAFSFCVVENMEEKDVSGLKKKIEKVDHVKDVIWYDSIVDLSFPVEILPEEIYELFNTDHSTLMIVLFDESTSDDGTLAAVEKIRRINDKQCFLAGMSPVIVDTKNLSEHEEPIYVAIAVLLSLAVLSLLMDSFLVPLIFLIGIGMAILYNMGTNVFFGDISYVTKALAAVLQLGVTMDYSIFLWNSYKEQRRFFPDRKEAMAEAVTQTVLSVVGSSITTVAGFIALCFMSFTLGLDLGLVMAKGVLIGVICCVTILPSMILIFDRALEKTKHRSLLPKTDRLSRLVTKRYAAFAVIFAVLLIPAVWGYRHTDVYYKLDSSLPKYLSSIRANEKLEKQYHMSTTDMALVSADLPVEQVREMAGEIDQVDGVKFTLGLDNILGPAVPADMLPGDLTGTLENDHYKILLVGSKYPVASDEVNRQSDEIEKIMKRYDKGSMLVGEAPCTRDLIKITDRDFKVVSAVSIGAIFLILLLVFKSAVLPVILVGVIEFAIFINMGIPAFTGSVLPFIASIVIGTIQLGSTVDYAILMTNRYKQERIGGKSKKDAVFESHRICTTSVIVSALSFFAATIGVGIYSDIDMISALCLLMARGALISMLVVIFILPSMYMIFDKIICRSTAEMRSLGQQSAR
ncbi:MAG: MMPL family transporter [Lachnospiraceae bacterium]|nr:MMPL family transporter [Lachnospiraceae bacterium]